LEYAVLLEREAIKGLRRLEKKTAQKILGSIEKLKAGFTARLYIKKVNGFRTIIEYESGRLLELR